MFESYVNFAGSKAAGVIAPVKAVFESYVNFAGSKADKCEYACFSSFESYVNFAGNKAYGKDEVVRSLIEFYFKIVCIIWKYYLMIPKV